MLLLSSVYVLIEIYEPGTLVPGGTFFLYKALTFSLIGT